jgi:hypothetical protein
MHPTQDRPDVRRLLAVLYGCALAVLAPLAMYLVEWSRTGPPKFDKAMLTLVVLPGLVGEVAS